MRNSENICKFVDITAQKEISIHNFVFEKNATKTKDLQTLKYHSMNIVTNGNGILKTANGEKKISQGNIFFTFKQTPFYITNENDLEYIYISFEGPRSDDLFTRFGISPANCIFLGHEKLSAFWQSAIVKAGEKNLDLISESVLLYTFGEMAPTENNQEQYLVNRIIKIIEENFKEPQFNLNSVSENLGYNVKYISRVFKNDMGITFSEYLTNTRIQHAIFLIEQNVTSIKNIAILSGYHDPLYFSNVFKNKIGISPKEYISKKEKVK